MKQTLKLITRYLLWGFVLNFLWEIAQSGLYAPHFVGLHGLILVHLRAALGDVIILLTIYLLGAGIFRDKNWIEEWSLRHAIFAGSAGAVVAVIIERLALDAGRWAYVPAMPIIPGVHMGLTPVLQMVILPVLIIRIINQQKNERK